MTIDDIPFDRDEDHNDEQRFRSEENQQYHEDCLERADDMRQELRSIWND